MQALNTAAGLDSDDALNQIGALIGDLPTDAAAHRVGQQDDWSANHVQQRRSGLSVEFPSLAVAPQKLHLGLRKIIEDGVTHLSGAGPLRVVILEEVVALFLNVGPDLHQVRRGTDRQPAVNTWLAVKAGHLGRASASWGIHHVEDVTPVDEVI